MLAAKSLLIAHPNDSHRIAVYLTLNQQMLMLSIKLITQLAFFCIFISSVANILFIFSLLQLLSILGDFHKLAYRYKSLCIQIGQETKNTKKNNEFYLSVIGEDGSPHSAIGFDAIYGRNDSYRILHTFCIAFTLKCTAQ